MTLDLNAARERAEKWLDTTTTRGNAINEQVMALDVRELVEEVIALHQALELATGPHCSSCGNPIDPDWCHCGEDVKHHGGGYESGHGFCPMGCTCGYADPDWKALAKSRGEYAWTLRREMSALLAATGPTPAELNAEVERLRGEVAKMSPIVEAAKAWRVDPGTRSRWLLGVDERLAETVDAAARPMPVDDTSRCAVCQWPLAETPEQGCVRGNCSMRPLPANYYAPERAAREQADMIRGVPADQRGKERAGG